MSDQKARQSILPLLKKFRQGCTPEVYDLIADAILERLSELQPVNPEWMAKDVPTFGGINSGDKMLTEKAVKKADDRLISQIVEMLIDKIPCVRQGNIGYVDVAREILSILQPPWPPVQEMETKAGLNSTPVNLNKPVNKTDKELLNHIQGIFHVNMHRIPSIDEGVAFAILEKDFIPVSEHIASILPRREADKGLIEALKNELTESENKAMRFAEWTSINKWFYDHKRKCWWHFNEFRKSTFAELFSSPEFAKYLEDSCAKS